MFQDWLEYSRFEKCQVIVVEPQSGSIATVISYRKSINLLVYVLYNSINLKWWNALLPWNAPGSIVASWLSRKFKMNIFALKLKAPDGIWWISLLYSWTEFNLGNLGSCSGILVRRFLKASKRVSGLSKGVVRKTSRTSLSVSSSTLSR